MRKRDREVGRETKRKREIVGGERGQRQRELEERQRARGGLGR